MVTCDICHVGLVTKYTRRPYIKCKKCGFTFCGRSCQSAHICGVTRKVFWPAREGGFMMFAMVFISVWILMVCLVVVDVWFLLYSLLPLGLGIGFVLLEKRDQRTIPQRIAKAEAKAPPCPLCGNKTQYAGLKMKRYHCLRCGKYL